MYCQCHGIVYREAKLLFEWFCEKNTTFILVTKQKLILRVFNNIDWSEGFIKLLPLRTGSYSDWFSVGARCRCVQLTAVVRNFITDIYQNHTREPYRERFTHFCVVGKPDDGAGPHTKARERSYTLGSDALDFITDSNLS